MKVITCKTASVTLHLSDPHWTNCEETHELKPQCKFMQIKKCHSYDRAVGYDNHCSNIKERLWNLACTEVLL